MVTTEFRRFTRSERAKLRVAQLNRWEGIGVSSLLWIIIVCAGSFGLVAVRRSFELPKSMELPSLIALLLFATVVAVFHYVRTRRWYVEPQWRAELDEGVAEVRRFSAVDAVRVEEFEDEGASFFLRLADNRVLFLSGQYLYTYDEQRQFPCSEFEVVRTPKSKVVLDVHCTGAYLPPSFTRRAFSQAEWRKNTLPQDGDIMEVDFDSFKTDAI